MNPIEIDTWQEAAKQWSEGGIVWSAELGGGGLGPGYEQAIQILLFEILARWPQDQVLAPAHSEYPVAYTKHVEAVIGEINASCGGFSDAQVGAAKATAYQFMRYGYRYMMEKLEKDRWIQVCKAWLRTKEAPPELLKAARAALSLLRGSGFTENTGAIQLLTAAIAKAEAG